MNMEDLKTKLAASERIAVLTGAGISSESGIPTFRGEGGLWETFRAEDLATPEAFARDPAFVWRWYEMRREYCQKAQPNAGHCALARLESSASEVRIFTQNVDGLHQRAGSAAVVELHGNLFTGRCTVCGRIKKGLDSPLAQIPPWCPGCGGLLRPDVLWFGEHYDAAILEEALQFLRRSNVVLIVGTSAAVSVPAQLAQEAMQYGAFSIEVNPQETMLSAWVDCHLSGNAGEVLPKLV